MLIDKNNGAVIHAIDKKKNKDRPGLNNVYFDMKNRRTIASDAAILAMVGFPEDRTDEFPDVGKKGYAGNDFVLSPDALQKAIKNIPKEKDVSAMPILRNILVSETEGGVELTTTDLEIDQTVKAKFPPDEYPAALHSVIENQTAREGGEGNTAFLSIALLERAVKIAKELIPAKDRKHAGLKINIAGKQEPVICEVKGSREMELPEAKIVIMPLRDGS